MIKGIVQDIKARPYNNKMLYSVKLNNAFYGLGDKNPRFKPGDEIEFDFKTNPRGFNDVITATLKTIRVSEGEQINQNVPAAGAAAKAVPVVNFAGKDDYWTRKEARDIKQDELREIGATRNTAIEFIRLLIDKEALKLPSKVADREDFAKALLDDYVKYFRGMKEPEAEEVIKDPIPTEIAPVEDADKWN